MEVDEEPRSHVVNDIFGYRKIVWKVDNYLPATCGYHWVIRSPEFCIYSPGLTKWRLCVRPKYNEKRYSVVVYLERLEYDLFPDTVQVLWKLYFPTTDISAIPTENSHMFQTNWAFGTEIPNIIDLEGIVLKESGNFTIRCHMIVYIADDNKLMELSKDAGLKSLSQDLSVLCVVEKWADTRLFFGSTDTINVHKAIVSCRNRVLKNLIGDDHLVDLHFQGINSDGLRKIICFLYTGDLKYVLRTPSFSIEKAVEYFDVDELKQYYSSDELTLETEITITEAQFEWTVRNLDKITNGCILGHCMRSVGNNEIFRLVLYPKGTSGTEKYMSLQVKFLEGIQPGQLCISFGIFDSHNKVQHLKCMRFVPTDSEYIILDHFMSRKVLNNPLFVTNGIMKLFCRFQRYVAIVHKPLIENETYPITLVNKFKHYDILSQQITSLLETGDYSDCTIESEGQSIRVHKMIICCRSRKLAKMLEGHKTSVSLPDIKPSIIFIILRYIYSGVLENCKPDDILKVYDVANRLCVQTLINTCSHILRENLDYKNAVEILTAAYMHKDWRLKFAAFKFINDNIDEVEKQECWKKLMNEHESLCQRWTAFRNSHSKEKMLNV